MSPVHVVALVKGAVEGDAFQHLGTLLGFAAHRATAARLGLVTIDEANLDEARPERVTVTKRGRRFYRDANLAALPAGRADHWGDAAAEAVRLLDAIERG